MICACRETISVGANAVCRTGNNSKAPITINVSNSCLRFGRQRLKRLRRVSADQQYAHVLTNPLRCCHNKVGGACSSNTINNPRR
ncbi:hypothetical protein D3C85_1727960 [compost metagenome]